MAVLLVVLSAPLRADLLVVAQCALFVPLLIALFDLLAFIVQALAAAEAELELDEAPFEVEPKRYEGVTLFLRVSLQALDFLFVCKELAGAHRLMVVDIAVGVLGNVQSFEP